MRPSQWMTLLGACLLFTTGLNAETTVTSSPSIRLEAGDPTNFEVTPSIEQEGMIAEGSPIRLIFGNASEGLRIRGVDLLPSSWVGPYQLEVTADDGVEQSTKSVSFTYAPIRNGVELQKNGIIWVPSSKTALANQEAQYALYTQQFTDELPSPYTGSYALKAAIKEGSDVGLRVNNVSVLPGRKPVSIGGYNFDLENGRINLPLAAFDEDDAGRGTLLITVDRPGAPVVEVDYKVWEPTFTLNPGSSTIVQGADQLQVNAVASPANFCGVASSYEDAEAYDVFTAPKCLVEWDVAGVQAQAQTSALQINKRVYEPGTVDIGLNAYVLNSDGTKVLVSRAETPITVQSAADIVAFGLRNAPEDAIERIVEESTFEVIQETGPTCTLYSTESEAQSSAGSRMSCVLEWDTIPEGLSVQTNTYYPTINGFFTAEEEQEEFSFSVYMVDEQGTKRLLDQKSYTVDLIDPGMPDIEFAPLVDLYGDVLAVPKGQDSIGYLTAKDIKSKLEVTARNGDGSPLLETTVELPYGRSIAQQRIAVPAPDLAIGTVDVLTLGAQYEKLSGIKYEEFKTVVATPSYLVRPELKASQEEALNTDAVTVTVEITDGQSSYDANTMGTWEVRVLERAGIGEYQELSDWMATDASGQANVEIDLSGYGAGGLRLTAEARLVMSSPIGEDIIRESSRYLAIEILDGTAIDGNISSRKIAGPAPLSTVIDFRPEDYSDRRAMGDVTFEVSEDSGGSWTEFTSNNGSTRLVQTFEEGTYLVRAVVENANSGQLFTTDPIEIVAFKIPTLIVEGPEIAFEGETVTADLAVTYDEATLPAAEYVLERSQDRRKTWEQVTSLSETITSAESATVSTYYRVRHIDAPADNRYSWADAMHRVSFRRLRPPRVRVNGERRVEVGEPYEFRAAITEPYRGLERSYDGEWTLPDGTKQYGDTVTYIPTEDDLDNRQLEISYQAWMTDYPEEIGRDDQRLYLWQYEWPTWRLAIDRKSYYPPAIVEIRAKTLGSTPSLEDPRYTWQLPEGPSVESNSLEDMRVLKVETTGEFTVGLAIADARGNETTLEETFEILPAPPIELDLRLREGNEHFREPLEVSLDTIMRGGHPDDRPVKYSYYVNGELSTEDDRPRQSTVLSAGSHTVRVDVETEFGQTIQETKSIDVYPNQEPVCELTGDMFSTSYSYKAYCDDPDGTVTDYRWTINGTVIDTVRGYRMTTPRADYETVPTVSVVAIDDSGAESAEVSLSDPDA